MTEPLNYGPRTQERRIHPNIPLLNEGQLEAVLQARWEEPSRTEARSRLEMAPVTFGNYVRSVNLNLGTETLEESMLVGMERGIIQLPEKPEDAPTMYLTTPRFRLVQDIMQTGASREVLAERHGMDVREVQRIIFETAHQVGLTTSRDYLFNLFRWAHQNNIAESGSKRSYLVDPQNPIEKTAPRRHPAEHLPTDIALIESTIRHSRDELASMHQTSPEALREKVKKARRRMLALEIDTADLDRKGIAQGLHDGKSVAEIASALGTTEVSIVRGIIDHGINRRTIPHILEADKPKTVREKKPRATKEKGTRKPRTKATPIEAISITEPEPEHIVEEPVIDTEEYPTVYTLFSGQLEEDEQAFQEPLAGEPIDPVMVVPEAIDNDPEPLPKQVGITDIDIGPIEDSLTDEDLALFDRIAMEATELDEATAIDRVVATFGYPRSAPRRLLRKLRELVAVEE